MTDTETNKTIVLWDPIVQIGHWVLVAGFFTTYFTGDEFFQQHVWAGYVVAATVAMRIVWGFIGPKHARFSSFVRSPAAIGAYLDGPSEAACRAQSGERRDDPGVAHQPARHGRDGHGAVCRR